MPWPADNPASNGSEILDRTGSWTTLFAFSLGLLLFAIVASSSLASASAVASWSSLRWGR
jgi:hypothetical protein